MSRYVATTVFVSVLVLSTMLCDCLFAQASISLYADAAVDAEINRIMDRDEVVGMGVAIVYDGEIVYVNGYGYEDREAKIIVDPSKTRFRWASISKTLAGTTAVMADADGLVDLDANVSDYYSLYKAPSTYYTGGPLKSIPWYDRFITLRQLLSHTAGIQHYSNGTKSPVPPQWMREDASINTGMEWAVRYWMKNPLVFRPGRDEEYSTFGVNLAGVALEKRYHTSFDQLVQDRIATPAGMTTLRPDTLWNKAPRRAVGYLIDDGEVVRDTYDDDVSYKLAGGGFISTVEDLGLYAKALLGDQLLTPSEKDEMWTRQTLKGGAEVKRGLGWEEVGSRNGHKRVYHTGGQRKARTLLMLYPEDGLGICIMCNAGYNVGLGDFSNAIEDIIRERLSTGQAPIQRNYDLLLNLTMEAYAPLSIYKAATSSYRLSRYANGW